MEGKEGRRRLFVRGICAVRNYMCYIEECFVYHSRIEELKQIEKMNLEEQVKNYTDSS